ncbi:MAG: porin [Alphaproteobacteria bacterium]|nr:porin [Alphaproteobacteria bacterium]
MDDRIGQLQQQIQTLQKELKSLRAEVKAQHATPAQPRPAPFGSPAAANQPMGLVPSQGGSASPSLPGGSTAASLPAAAPPPTPHVTQSATNRFGLESADGQNSIALTGRLHFDAGDYLDYDPQSKRYSSVQDLNSGVNARRARLGVTGKFQGDWVYTLIYDFGGSTDASPGAAGSGLEAAFLTYNGLNRGPVPLAFDLGYMDTPFTLDEATSSNDIMFVERASIQAIASGIMANDFRSALGVRSNDSRYWAGVYLTGPQSGASHTSGEPLGAFGRATYQVLQSPDYSLHLGVDVGGLLKPSAVNGVRTITLSDRPEDRVDPTAILSTGALGTAANPVNDAAAYGVEAAIGYENLFAQGEYYRITVDRDGLPTNSFDGGYIEASWTLTGEHRNYIPATGAYSAIVPAHPFAPWNDDFGLGAFELAGRFSTVDLNDNFTPGAAPGSTNAVGGGKQTVYTAGLNWYPSANIRFMFDYLHGSIDKRFSTAAGGGITGTPLGTPIGGNFDAVVLRTQFAF